MVPKGIMIWFNRILNSINAVKDKKGRIVEMVFWRIKIKRMIFRSKFRSIVEYCSQIVIRNGSWQKFYRRNFVGMGKIVFFTDLFDFKFATAFVVFLFIGTAFRAVQLRKIFQPYMNLTCISFTDVFTGSESWGNYYIKEKKQYVKKTFHFVG